MLDLAEKLGMKMHGTTAAHSPLINHEMADDKHINPNNKGFVYGNNTSIPGVTNSTLPSLSTEYTSKDVRDHIGKINKAREAFRVADNDERIKRAIRSRIASYTNEQFQSEDRVYFKEKDKMQWSGPAIVTVANPHKGCVSNIAMPQVSLMASQYVLACVF